MPDQPRRQNGAVWVVCLRRRAVREILRLLQEGRPESCQGQDIEDVSALRLS